jgi:SRSO17 transposase
LKYLLNILLIVIVFTGCSATQNNLDTKKSKSSLKIELIKPKKKQIKKEIKTNAKTIMEENVRCKILAETNNKKISLLSDDKKSIIVKKKITLLYSSKKIGQYAITASNTTMAYLITKKHPFDLEVIDMKDESLESFKKAFKELKKKNIKNIVAIITNQNYNNLIQTKDIEEFNIFLPLIHKNNISKLKENIIYGGVDYEKQLKVLTKYSRKRGRSKEIQFYDNSLFGKILNKQLKQINKKLLFSKEIDDNSGKYAKYLKKNRRKLNSSTLFINTPIVKSSILLSQLKANEVTPKKILSTQINYTPLILSLTQARDRKNMLIANSIKDINKQLRENILNLGNDIVYDWLAYSTLVGVDYFYTKDNRIEQKIINNQIQYDIKIYKAKYYSFLRVK